MFAPAFSSLKHAQKFTFDPLPESVDSLYLAKQFEPDRKYLILTENARNALRLKDELNFFQPDLHIAYFPDWETLPYDQFSPGQDLVSQRLATLWQLKQGQVDVLIVPVATAMHRIVPVEFVLGRTFWLKAGQRLDVDKLRHDLVHAGYQHVTQVVSAGEFSIRGGLIDLFPTGSVLPYRIDLFDDEVDKIKAFDVDTQRTIYPVSEIKLMPAHEFPTDDTAQTTFRQKFREHIESDPTKAKVYNDVTNGLFGAGVENYLPFFFEKTATILDYCASDVVVVEHGHLAHAAEHFSAEVSARYNMATGNPLYPPVKPAQLFLNTEQFFVTLKDYTRAVLPIEKRAEYTLADMAVERRSEKPLEKLHQFCGQFEGKILLCADSLGRRETMTQFLGEHGFKPVLVAK